MAIQTNHDDVEHDTNVFGEVLVHTNIFKIPPSPGSNSKKTLGCRLQQRRGTGQRTRQRATTPPPPASPFLSPLSAKKTIVVNTHSRSLSPKSTTMRSPLHYKTRHATNRASPVPLTFSFENDSESDEKSSNRSTNTKFFGKSNCCNNRNCTCDFCNVEEYYGHNNKHDASSDSSSLPSSPVSSSVGASLPSSSSSSATMTPDEGRRLKAENLKAILQENDLPYWLRRRLEAKVQL